jgi:surfeit locus 1 family protein
VIGQKRTLLWPAVMTLAMLTVLIGLGTWQVYRLRWKLGIMAQIAHAEAADPVPLASDPTPFAKVSVTGDFHSELSAYYGAEVRDTPSGPQLGSRLIVPLERNGAPALLVDRGWVPQTRRAPIDQPEGIVTVVGYVRPGDKPAWFSATDDVAARQFYTLNPAKIGAALGEPEVAPFILVALGSAPASLWPDPARHLPLPPNNHLSYAITWYGLAVALAVVFIVWARKAART